jgi:hypothetical protein
VALTGGMVAPGRPLREQVVRGIARLGLKLPICDRPIDAARGAAALARTHARA